MAAVRPSLALLWCLSAMLPACQAEDSVSVVEPGGGWAPWCKWQRAVFDGHFDVASDPSIIRDGDTYRMFYTTIDWERDRTIICQAVSADGLRWRHADTDGRYPGTAIAGLDDRWNENLEGALILQHEDRYHLYYQAYTDESNEPARGFPASMGLAVSEDGLQFRHASPEPILAPTPGWYDNDACYSPTIVPDGDGYLMVYVGHAITDVHAIGRTGAFLLIARSPDGVHWEKHPTPIMEPGVVPWARDGVAEPCLVRGPDQRWYLFFTSVHDDERQIGVAVADQPTGPYTVCPVPILRPTTPGLDDHHVLAPTVLIEGDRVRMWFFGLSRERTMRIGYAEARWPLLRADNHEEPSSRP